MIKTSPHVTDMSHEMPKFARYCLRLLKRKEKEKSEFFCDFLEATGVPEEGVEPTLTVCIGGQPNIVPHSPYP